MRKPANPTGTEPKTDVRHPAGGIMAYYELNVICERCRETKIFVGMAGRRSAVSAAKSHGWYPAVGTSMWICDDCQKPAELATLRAAREGEEKSHES
jgi:hypothetical protein